jgi:hypothetical protein
MGIDFSKAIPHRCESCAIGKAKEGHLQRLPSRDNGNYSSVSTLMNVAHCRSHP